MYFANHALQTLNPNFKLANYREHYFIDLEIICVANVLETW